MPIELVRRLVGLGSAADPMGGRMLLLSRISYALLLLAALGAAFLAFRTSSAEHWVRHTISVRSEAQLFLSDLQKAVIRERGFLLTGEERYLGDFQGLTDSLNARIEDLKQRVSDNPNQIARLTDIQPDLRKLQATLSATIELKRAGQSEQAVDLVRSAHVQDVVEEIKSSIDDFVRIEGELLIKRRAHATTLQTLLVILIVASLAVAAALSIALESSTRHFVKSLRERTDELEGEIERRRETEATLRQAQKMEAIGQLSGGIAHDFNNLLTVIMGNLDTMKRNLANTTDLSAVQAKLNRQIDMAMQGARSAANLTHRLLAFARRQPLDPSPVDCNRLISGMSELLQRTLGETVQLETVLSGGLWWTLADPSQVESALVNLAVNAQHAMPAGGRLTIETANACLDDAYVSRFGDVRSGQYVQISVADTGTGISAEILDRVLEPFFTTRPAEGGTGLGLSMVHGFVKQSGGHLRIYSEMGHGTTVKIYLPRHTETSQIAASPSGSTPSAIVRPAPDGEIVLIVEDNDGVREYARSILTELGYSTREAANGEQALAIIESGEPIDLLFTDVVLPGGMSGRQLSDRIHQIRPDLPVLFTTGYTPNAIVHHGRLDPGVVLISKPYTRENLALKVSQMLAARQKTG